MANGRRRSESRRPSQPASRPRRGPAGDQRPRYQRQESVKKDTLRRLYERGVTLVRAEFGAFRLAGPGPACEGEADLRQWIARNEAVGLTA